MIGRSILSYHFDGTAFGFDMAGWNVLAYISSYLERREGDSLVGAYLGLVKNMKLILETESCFNLISELSFFFLTFCHLPWVIYQIPCVERGLAVTISVQFSTTTYSLHHCYAPREVVSLIAYRQMFSP